jgi:hypothetical protein
MRPAMTDKRFETVLRDLMTAYAACNGEDHPAYEKAEKLLAGKFVPSQPPQDHVSLGEDGEQFVRDAIRSGYDRGYNDARNAKSVSGDSALGYRGRDMSDEIATDVLARMRRLPSPETRALGPNTERVER